MPGRAIFRGPILPSVRSAWWREAVPVPTTVSTLRMECREGWVKPLVCVQTCAHSHSIMGDPKDFSADFVLIINFAHEDKFISNVTTYFLKINMWILTIEMMPSAVMCYGRPEEKGSRSILRWAVLGRQGQGVTLGVRESLGELWTNQCF